MKRILYITTSLLLSTWMLMSCSSSSHLSSSYDSIYYNPDNEVEYASSEKADRSSMQNQQSSDVYEEDYYTNEEQMAPEKNRRAMDNDGMTINNYYGNYASRLRNFHHMNYYNSYSPFSMSMRYNYGMFDSWSMGMGYNSYGMDPFYGMQYGNYWGNPWSGGFNSPYYNSTAGYYYGLGYNTGFYNGLYANNSYNNYYPDYHVNTKVSEGPRRGKVTDGRRPAGNTQSGTKGTTVSRNDDIKSIGSGNAAKHSGSVTRISREGLITDGNKSENEGRNTKYIRTRIQRSNSEGNKNSSYSSSGSSGNAIFNRNSQTIKRTRYSNPKNSYNSSANRRSSSSSSGYRRSSSSSSSSNYGTRVNRSSSNSGSFNKSSSGNSSSSSSSSGRSGNRIKRNK